MKRYLIAATVVGFALWGCCQRQCLAPPPATADSMIPKGCAPAATSYLTVEPVAQEAPFWCWAASGQMIMGFLGTHVSQCVQAADWLNKPDGICPCGACGAGTGDCNVGGWPQFCRYGFTAQATQNQALTWDAIKAQLGARAAGCAGTPIAFSWKYEGFGGHMMVANGYNTEAGQNILYVVNPLTESEGDPLKEDIGCAPDVTFMDYDTYKELPGEYTHWNDYYAVSSTTI